MQPAATAAKLARLRHTARFPSDSAEEPSMPVLRIADALKTNPSSTGNGAAEATVQGWVRTRRDSKAGVSFVAIGDGSCFDSIQLVVPSELANYQSEVLR